MAVAEIAFVNSEKHAPVPSFSPRERVPALDGLRGIAILAVFFYHYAGKFIHSGTAVVHSGSAAARFVAATLGIVFALGWSGVDLFFVLSGFLITGILYDTRHDPNYYRNFYARRTLRIFPIYYLFAVLTVLLGVVIGARWKVGDLFFLVYLGYPAALLWPAMVQISPLIAITHLWSLCAEEQFYLVWPWLIAQLRTRKAILLGCLGLAFSAVSMRTAICVFGWVDVHWAYGFLLCRADDLALGAAIAVLIRSPLRRRLERWAPVTFLLAAGSVAAICLFRHSADYLDAAMASVGYSFLGIAYGSLLLLSLKSYSWVQAVMSLHLLRVFGKYSYGLYLYHFPLSVVLSPMRTSLTTWTRSFWIGSLLHIVICLLINLGVAALSFLLIESPIMRMKKRFSYRRPIERAVAIL